MDQRDTTSPVRARRAEPGLHRPQTTQPREDRGRRLRADPGFRVRRNYATDDRLSPSALAGHLVTAASCALVTAEPLPPRWCRAFHRLLRCVRWACSQCHPKCACVACGGVSLGRWHTHALGLPITSQDVVHCVRRTYLPQCPGMQRTRCLRGVAPRSSLDCQRGRTSSTTGCLCRLA